MDPQHLGFDPEVVKARILTWWCVYIVDIWDAALRGRPPGLHEGEYNVSLPMLSESPSEEEMYFERLTVLTRILSQVLSFGFNHHQTSSSLGTALDISAEETVRNLRKQLAVWHRSLEEISRTSLLYQNLEVAYLTIVILLHRPLLPTPLATAFQDPILLLITNCASSIVQIAHATGGKVAGTVPWRLFLPAVGYLTAGVTLAQNAAWSTHITGAATLRQSAQRDIKVLLEVFDRAEANGHYTSGMSGLLLSIFQRSEVDLNGAVDTVPEIPGTALRLPHEDPAFFATRIRPSPEKPISLPEKRPSVPMMQPLAPLSLPPPRSHSLSDLSFRKRKHTEISHLSTPTHKPVAQQLPSLTSLPGLDSGIRSPTVHSISTYSSHSSNSLGRHASLYQPLQPPPSTAYHPTYTTPPEPPINRHLSRQYDPARPISPPP